MQTIILTIGGIFWILTYIFIISKGFKDKTYGMPLIALCANISWEFIWSFILPSSVPQLFINYLWFGLDCVIVFQFFKYRRNEFPNLSLSEVYIVFGLIIFSAFSIILTGAISLDDHRGVYAAFGQNLLMSILFVVMFFKRGEGLRGQSIFIALFKMIGTGLTSLHFYLYEPVSQSSFVLPSVFVLILFFDLLYVLLVANSYNKNEIPLLKI
ncbi:MAG: hypothetical protein ACRD8Z_16585 [Nitrososphaeraceae archaeon]